ncbi:MAG: molybdenum cofactor guanylyltransferase [Candidatus Eisenbacteria bacterium]
MVRSTVSKWRQMALPLHSVGRVAAVLAGGESVRMGRDKARLLAPNWTVDASPRTWLERTIGCLAPFVEECWVLGREVTQADWPHLDPLPPSRPDRSGGRGPLGGIDTALALAGGKALIVAACDLPNLTPLVVVRLLREGERAPHADAVAFAESQEVTASAESADAVSFAGSVGARTSAPHPRRLAGLFLIVRAGARAAVDSALANGDYGIQRLLCSIDTHWVDADEEVRLALLPANSPEDIEDRSRDRRS